MVYVVLFDKRVARQESYLTKGNRMDLLSLIILLAVIGVLLWAVNTYLPMEPRIKQILNVVVIIAVVVFILSLFSGYFPHIRVGR